MTQTKIQKISVILYSPENTNHIKIVLKQFNTTELNAKSEMIFSEITNALNKIIKKHNELIEG